VFNAKQLVCSFLIPQNNRNVVTAYVHWHFRSKVRNVHKGPNIGIVSRRKSGDVQIVSFSISVSGWLQRLYKYVFKRVQLWRTNIFQNHSPLFLYVFGLTNFMDDRPYGKYDSVSADKEILCFSRELKAPYNFHASPQLSQY
jgi:hypothetical protein